MIKIYTCRFIFENDFNYKDLAPVFPDIFKYVLNENGHFQSNEDLETREMYIELNMQDIMANRKPEGYNRRGRFRMMFPIDKKEFYIKGNANKQIDIKRIGGTIDGLLNNANICHTLKYDYTVDCLKNSKGAFTLMDNNFEVVFPATYEFGKILRANIRIKKTKKDSVFGYVINNKFRPLAPASESIKSIEKHIEIIDDISFGFQKLNDLKKGIDEISC